MSSWTFVGGIGATTSSNGFFAINYAPAQPTTYAIQNFRGMSVGSTYELRVVTGQKCNGSVSVDVFNSAGTSLATISLGNPGSYGNANSANYVQTANFVANSYTGSVKVNKTADPTSCQIEIDKIFVNKL